MIKSKTISTTPTSNKKTPKKEKESNTKLFEQYSVLVNSEDKNQKDILKQRNKIIVFNQPLVTHVINKYFSKTIRSKSTMQDLIQEGTFGLITAIDRFKPEKGYKFSTYAAWWIRQAVNESLREKESPIVIPPHIINIQNKYIAAAQANGISFEEAIEIDYKKGLITKKMMLSAIAAINCNKTFVSIGGNSSNRKSSGGRTAVSSSSDDSSSITKQVSMNSPYKADIDSQETEIDKYNVIKSVKDALIKIGPKKRNVILLRYGIVDKPIMLKNELLNNKTEKETL